MAAVCHIADEPAPNTLTLAAWAAGVAMTAAAAIRTAGRNFVCFIRDLLNSRPKSELLLARSIRCQSAARIPPSNPPPQMQASLTSQRHAHFDLTLCAAIEKYSVRRVTD